MGDDRRDALEASIRIFLPALGHDELRVVDQLVTRLFKDRLDREASEALERLRCAAPDEIHGDTARRNLIDAGLAELARNAEPLVAR